MLNELTTDIRTDGRSIMERTLRASKDFLRLLLSILEVYKFFDPRIVVDLLLVDLVFYLSLRQEDGATSEKNKKESWRGGGGREGGIGGGRSGRGNGGGRMRMRMRMEKGGEEGGGAGGAGTGVGGV